MILAGPMESDKNPEPAMTTTTAPETLVATARKLVSCRRFGKAVECLDRALELHPEASDWIRYRGEVLQIVARHEEALRDFERLLQMSPADAMAWQKLAHSLRSLGRIQEAETAYLEALKLAPDSVNSMADLGILYRDAGRHEEALDWLSKAADQAPSDGSIHAMLGAALLAAGQAAKGRQSLEKALQLNPYDRTTLAYLYIAFCQTGDVLAVSTLTRPELLIRSFQRPGSASVPGRPDDLDQRLARHVREHPTLVYERSGNTTRGGAHTGNLLEEAPGPVTELVDWIEDRARAYLNELPMDGSHPYLAWKPDRWDIDIWGIVIQAGGYQQSHIHRDGWISGVYYAVVPDSVQASADDDPGGCLELGRPLEPFCGSTDFPTTILRPRPGRLNLFPSFVWHRTLPYDTDEERICIAFDIRPKL